MRKSRREKYYINEGVILVTAKGGNKRTGAGGIVSKSQNAMTCATCFALVPEHHLVAHTNTHFGKPIEKRFLNV